MLSALITGKLAALALCTTAGVGTVATAAYANALPTPIQGFAHSAIGAPAPHESGTHAQLARSSHRRAPLPRRIALSSRARRPTTPSRPSHHQPNRRQPSSAHPSTVTTTKTTADVGPYSLCLAYHAAVEHHTALDPAMLARLVTFAGGAENLVTFCTKTLTPSPSTDSVALRDDLVQLATYSAGIDRGVQLPASAQAPGEWRAELTM